MYRLLTAAALAGALLFAACGSSDSPTNASAPVNTIKVSHVDGVGDVLVDATGHALYTPEQEANGKIHCVDKCLSFWLPLEAGMGGPSAAENVGSVAEVRRPDDTKQVTVNGKPVYSFSEDKPGKVSGDGFKDEFGGQSFTWHVVLAGGRQSDAASSDRGEYGY